MGGGGCRGRYPRVTTRFIFEQVLRPHYLDIHVLLEDSMGVFIDKIIETFELLAAAITELRQRVEALEALEKTRPVGEHPLTEVLPEVREADRSHVITVGESHYHL